MNVLLGVVLGLLLPWIWRLAREAHAARHDQFLDIHTKERREMLTKSGAL